MKWYFRAAEQGDAVAQYDLGVMYECGLGVDKNYSTVLEWYRRKTLTKEK